MTLCDGGPEATYREVVGALSLHANRREVLARIVSFSDPEEAFEDVTRKLMHDARVEAPHGGMSVAGLPAEFAEDLYGEFSVAFDDVEILARAQGGHGAVRFAVRPVPEVPGWSLFMVQMGGE